MNILHRDPDAAAQHFAVLLQLILDVQSQIDGYGKEHTHIAAGAAVDLRIDADDLAVDVEQRTTRIPGVNGGIGLDEGHIIGVAAIDQRTSYCTDDARRHAVFKTEGRADRNGPLTGAPFG